MPLRLIKIVDSEGKPEDGTSTVSDTVVGPLYEMEDRFGSMVGFLAAALLKLDGRGLLPLTIPEDEVDQLDVMSSLQDAYLTLGEDGSMAISLTPPVGK